MKAVSPFIPPLWAVVLHNRRNDLGGVEQRLRRQVRGCWSATRRGSGAAAEPARLAYLWRPTLPDVADDMVLETAVNGRATGIVTFNLRDFASPVEQFGMAVMSPGEALRRLEKKR